MMYSGFDEYDYLIHLVRSAIHGDTPEEIPDKDLFGAVYNCGVAHEVSNIAYYATDKLRMKPSSAVADKWIAKRNSAVMRDANQSFAYDEIIEELDAAGIKHVEVQGTRIKHLYPSPEYRTMSDIDLIVSPSDLAKAGKILEELGYKCEDNRGVEIDGFREPNIYVEIHTEFFSSDSEYYGVLGDPFAPILPSEGAFDPESELLYLYSVLHIAKHYYFAGCGIRRILDLYYLNKEFSEIAENERIKEFFQKVGIGSFVCDASELAECWFGDAPRVPDERLSHMAEVIKDAGVHGNYHHKVRNTLERKEKNGKAHYVLRRLFPEKWVMEKNYPVLKKAPVLTPFCLVHRFFKAVFTDRRRVTEEISDIRSVSKNNKSR